MGQVATIPAGMPFVDVLATDLLRRYGSEGGANLQQALVLVPTRRAIRSLGDAFLRASEGKALLLPAIRALGDLDEDDPDLMVPNRRLEAALPPAIDPVRRLFLLAQMIARSGTIASTADSLGLARTLSDLLDEVATERLDFAGLSQLVPEQFQAHWQQTIDFLRIVTHHWPDILKSEACMDPAARRDKVTALLAQSWRAAPVSTPVYIAGSTGSVPATADLMNAVLGLEQGHIILPGLDLDMDAADQQAALAEPVHPQHGMLSLLHGLGVDFADVISLGDQPAANREARRELLREVLRPASTSERWRDLHRLEAASLTGLRLIEAPGQREEAMAIALCLRQTLEAPGRTAALVTPDRSLARRVVAEMQRFQVPLDDSAGRPLRLTRVGGFLQLAATALDHDFAPVELLALLKHPLSSGGRDTAAFRREVRLLERRHLRGLRPYQDLTGLLALIDAEKDATTPGWLQQLADEVIRLRTEPSGLGHVLASLVALCEMLATSDQEPGAERLWRGDDGEAAALAIADVLDAADALPLVQGEPWGPILDRLIGGTVVRPRYGQHPRLSILGPLEARLQIFDRVVLGGLNEGVWPAATGNDPWMSRPMRAGFGLPAPERRTGLQAHDFLQLASSPDVVLTRASKVDGTPTVASRWLLRLESVARGAGLQLDRDNRFVDWAQMLDHPPAIQPVEAPMPRPAVALRPRTLPVTAIETLIRDPYAIFAARILKLRRLDPLDELPGPALKGNLIHEVFERLARDHDGDWTPQLWPQLQAHGDAVFAKSGLPASWQSLWLRRLHAAGRWLLDVEAQRPDRVVKRLVEIKGGLQGLPGLPDFTLTAKADRLDVLAAGGIVIGDYKTGSPPSPRQIEAGFAVQLPLTALIVGEGGFEQLPSRDVGALLHIRVDGVREGGRWQPVKVKDLDALIESTREGVAALLADYAKPTTPYRSRPFVQFARQFDGDFDHLARVREWSVASDTGESEDGDG